MTTLAWVHFDSIAAATAPVGELVAAGATAVELMVAPALMVAANSIPGTPEYWKELPLESAALLVEFGADDDDGLERGEAATAEVLAGLDASRSAAPEFTRDHETIELYWRVREGLHGLVGRLRPPGTALIVEDVCVPPARIAEAAEEIRALLAEHGFLTGVAGHASAGNLHFMLTPDFAKPEDVERYEAFMEKLVDADPRHLRRLAQGRARDRRQHGAVRRARVGRDGDRDDVADQGARRSRPACSGPASSSTATRTATSRT